MPTPVAPIPCSVFRALLALAFAASGTPQDATSQAREGYAVTEDSVRLWYRMVGEGSETVLVPVGVFHGQRLDGLAEGRRLVLYDPRGRGQSDSVPPTKVSLDNQIRDIETIRRAVGSERVAVIGWSGLGMEMFVYALRHPDRVTRLVQLAPVPPRAEPYMETMTADRQSRTDSAAFSALQARRGRGEFDGDEASWCRSLKRVTTPASFGEPRLASRVPDVCRFRNEWPSRLGPYFEALLGSFGAFDWRPKLSHVKIPRLVIHGERDNISLAGSKEWVAGQGQARLVVIPGAGHWPHYERPEQTLNAIREFLAGRWPEGSVGVR